MHIVTLSIIGPIMDLTLCLLYGMLMHFTVLFLSHIRVLPLTLMDYVHSIYQFMPFTVLFLSHIRVLPLKLINCVHSFYSPDMYIIVNCNFGCIEITSVRNYIGNCVCILGLCCACHRTVMCHIHLSNLAVTILTCMLTLSTDCWVVFLLSMIHHECIY